MLCEACLQPFRGARPPQPQIKPLPEPWTQSSLEALQECFVCTWIWRHISGTVQQDTSTETVQCNIVRDLRELESNSANESDRIWASYRINIMGYGIPEGSTVSFSLKSLSDSRGVPEESGSFENFTGSEATMVLAGQWLNSCVTCHESCEKSLVGTKMPTRLLQLMSKGVRLCVTDTSKPRFPYMTLSHCWGSAQFLKLTGETSQRLSEGVSLQELPQTFQDAVRVVKRLGVQFLWIDSLCIFQDSESDWQAEAATMADVYKGALCNIAATASDNSQRGIFRSRNPRDISCCFVTTQYTDHANDTYHLMQSDFRHHYIDRFLYSNEPLLTRGWVVQERLLAPRVLHFGKYEAFWECHEDVYSETYPHGVPIHESRLWGYNPPLKMLDPGAKLLKNTEKIGANENLMESRESVHDFWKSMVKLYTRCNLTKGDDKLVAIAGIAREIHGYLGGNDEYLGGLWRNELFVQLSWHTEHPWKTRPKPYRAPTWSWASVDAPVSFLPERSLSYWREFSNSLVSFVIDRSTPDDFGQVRSGSIRITGPLKTLICTYNPHETYYDPRFRCELKTTHPYEHGPTNSAPSVYWDIANDPEESSLVHENREVHRLHWMPFFPKDPHIKTSNVYGLILQPTGALKGQFKRMGVLQVMGPQLWSSVDVSRLAIADPQDSWLEYEDFDGTQYTISII